MGILARSFGTTEPSSLFLTHPLMLKIKTILLWLKGLENLEDESVFEKFPAFSQHFKKKTHKSIRNSVVCLFGVLCKLYYTLSTITTTKIRNKQSLSKPSKREDMENK